MIIEHEFERLLPKLPTWPFTRYGNMCLLVLAAVAIGIGVYISVSTMELRGLM